MHIKFSEKRILVYIVIAVIIAGAGLLYSGTYRIAVTNYSIAIDSLPAEFEGYTILHLSDLHSKRYGENQQELFGIINKQQFDLVVITGDLVDQRRPDHEPYIELIQGLKNYETYFVPGNHEHWAGFDQVKAALLNSGVVVMENGAAKLDHNGAHVWLLGVDDPSLKMDRLDLALKEALDDVPYILLAHSPAIYPAAIKESIDLVLVGHTHGGQIRIPLIGAVYVPGQGFFPNYDYGMYSSGQTTMVINAGLGESVIPIRFNMRPEIVLITLVPR
jgi:uncharacterized protein